MAVTAPTGVDFNSKNKDTNYTSGALFHMDATLLKTFENDIGIGVFGSILYQLQDDNGHLADALNGFKGRSFAVGPMVKYTHGKGLEAINFSLNWAPEFGVKNVLKAMRSISLPPDGSDRPFLKKSADRQDIVDV